VGGSGVGIWELRGTRGWYWAEDQAAASMTAGFLRLVVGPPIHTANLLTFCALVVTTSPPPGTGSCEAGGEYHESVSGGVGAPLASRSASCSGATCTSTELRVDILQVWCT